MSIFDIIDNVDWNKNIIFLVLYITMIVLCVFIYLVPLMDNYKSVIMEYRKTNILDNQINTTLDRLKGSEDEILKANAATFERLHNQMSAKDLQKYARTHIKGAKVEDLGVVEAENGILIHSFKITGQTRRLLSIRSLLSNVRELPNSVRIAFPITISKDERRGVLDFEVALMIYNSTRDISVIKAQLENGEIMEVEKIVESIKERESAESSNTIDIVETLEPTESPKSIESPKPSATQKSTKSRESTKSTKKNTKNPSESAKPSESSAKPTAIDSGDSNTGESKANDSSDNNATKPSE